MNWLVNQVWGGMLWLMRRPWIKRLQRASYSWGSEARQAKMRRAFIRQNQFARRYGRPMLRWMFSLLLAWSLIVFAFLFATNLQSSGVIEEVSNQR